MKKKFLPILLGSDANVYGMAKSFHKEYNIKSLAIGKKQLYPTSFSRIVKVLKFDNFDHQEVFIDKIIKVAKQKMTQYEKLILISCGDGYTELIVNNKELLSKYFVLPYINRDLKEKLENKEDFYKTCEAYGLDYPKTYICTYQNKDAIVLPFAFPVAVKASNSIEYLAADIVGKKKAYIVNDLAELQEIISNIYASKYRSNIIIQDYIPGSDDAMWVLNSYSNSKGKVIMMCLGHVLLEDYYPNDIGNYNVILTEANQAIYDRMQMFLESINYVGFSNFDMKYDYRDGKYKLFEINIRQGRSSYVVTGSNNNMAKLIVDDYINNIDTKITYNNFKWLWLGIPKNIVKKYVKKIYHKQIDIMFKSKQYGNTLSYNKDNNIIRNFIIYKLYDIQRKNYITYFNRKED